MGGSIWEVALGLTSHEGGSEFFQNGTEKAAGHTHHAGYGYHREEPDYNPALPSHDFLPMVFCSAAGHPQA